MKLNPVFKNEVKLSSRNMRTSLLVFLYNAVLLVVSMMVFYTIIQPAHYGYRIDFSGMVELYAVLAYLEFGMILLIIPVITSGSIAGERERQTLDMLLATKMRPRSIILGKLMSSLSSVLMFAVSSLPILSIVFVFGGVGILELLGFVIILSVSAVFVGSIGILYSAYARRVTSATIMTYLTVIFLMAGTYMLEKGIYSILQTRMAAVSDAEASVGNAIFLLLVNPAVTFYGMISNQVGSANAIQELCTQFGAQHSGILFELWIPSSVVIQLWLSLVFLALAARRIDPLK